MKSSERQTRSYLMKMFDHYGVHPRHYLGQNFLVDLNIVEYIVEQAELGPRDVVLEVGAGTGGMTTFMARKAGRLVSVEIDSNLIGIVRDAVLPFDNVTIVHGDALKNKNRFNPEVIEAVETQLRELPQSRLKLVANLPYAIATPVISNLVATELPWTRMVATIQLELAQRMAARPGVSNYGALSVWLQSQGNVKLLKKLPPTVFWPRPKVNSAVVQLTRSPEKQMRIADRRFYQDFLRRLFSQRRKFMRSTLIGMYRKQVDKTVIDDVLNDMNYGSDVRAEQLEPAQHVELANILCVAIRQASPPGTDTEAPLAPEPESRNFE